jgi:heterotetrameric sarcosine oxidase delta subunit
MLMIPCPWCGERHESEFVCTGEAWAPRPRDPNACDAQVWSDYLCLRNNLRGASVETWWHAKGCGLWFELERDTLTHEVRPYSPDSDQ